MPRHSKLSVSHINNVELGAEEEAKGNLVQAAKYYEAAIKDDRPDELPFSRLMVIYRKQKQYKDELRVIKQGIKKFEAFYKRQAKPSKGRKLSQLSEAFMKSSGLKDKKGNNIYNPEPIGKWMKRRQVVEKKATTRNVKAKHTGNSRSNAN
jgi:hypothetical protein